MTNPDRFRRLQELYLHLLPCTVKDCTACDEYYRLAKEAGQEQPARGATKDELLSRIRSLATTCAETVCSVELLDEMIDQATRAREGRMKEMERS